MTTRMRTLATLSRAGAPAWTWVSSPTREERDLSLTLIRGTRSEINFSSIFHYCIYLRKLQGFIATIPELIDGLDKIKNVMNQQRKITQAFGEAFDQCEACG